MADVKLMAINASGGSISPPASTDVALLSTTLKIKDPDSADAIQIYDDGTKSYISSDNTLYFNPGGDTSVRISDEGIFPQSTGVKVLGDNTDYFANAFAQGFAMPESSGDPSNLTDIGWLYTKDDSGDTELFWEDDSANVVQITKDGALNVAGESANITALTSNEALTGTDDKYQIRLPDAAGWTLTLPNSSVSQGKVFVVRNTALSGSGNYINIQCNTDEFDILWPGAAGSYIYDTGNIWRALTPWNEDANVVSDLEATIAIGRDAAAQDAGAIGIGNSANAADGVAVAIGSEAYADTGGIGIGRRAKTSASSYEICVGYRSNAAAYTSGGYAIAIGYNASALGAAGVALGKDAIGTTDSVAVGNAADATNRGVAVGYLADATTYGCAVGYRSIGDWYNLALGSFAQTQVPVTGDRYRIAIGSGTNHTASIAASTRGATVVSGAARGIALGTDAWVGQDNAISIGYQAKANHAGAVVIGRSGTDGASYLVSSLADAVHVNKLHTEAEIVLKEIAGDPTHISDKGQLYAKDVSGETELFWQDGDGGNTEQVTGIMSRSTDGFVYPATIGDDIFALSVDATGVTTEVDGPSFATIGSRWDVGDATNYIEGWGINTSSVTQAEGSGILTFAQVTETSGGVSAAEVVGIRTSDFIPLGASVNLGTTDDDHLWNVVYARDVRAYETGATPTQHIKMVHDGTTGTLFSSDPLVVQSESGATLTLLADNGQIVLNSGDDLVRPSSDAGESLGNATYHFSAGYINSLFAGKAGATGDLRVYNTDGDNIRMHHDGTSGILYSNEPLALTSDGATLTLQTDNGQIVLNTGDNLIRPSADAGENLGSATYHFGSGYINALTCGKSGATGSLSVLDASAYNIISASTAGDVVVGGTNRPGVFHVRQNIVAGNSYEGMLVDADNRYVQFGDYNGVRTDLGDWDLRFYYSSDPPSNDYASVGVSTGTLTIDGGVSGVLLVGGTGTEVQVTSDTGFTPSTHGGVDLGNKTRGWGSLLLAERSSAPDTNAQNCGALYLKEGDVSLDSELFYRYEENGIEVQITQDGDVIAAGVEGMNVPVPLTGAYTLGLTGDSNLKYQYLDPNSANRTITLQTSAPAGKLFVVKNIDAYNDSPYLSIVQQGGAEFDKLYAQQIGYYIFDGTNWRSAGFGDDNTADQRNVTLGPSTVGYNDGTALGYTASAYTNGTAVGNAAVAHTSGTALGKSTDGSTSGVAMGISADGRNSSVAVGAFADTSNEQYSLAIGGGTTSTPDVGVSTAGAHVASGAAYGIAMGHDAYVGGSSDYGVAIGKSSKIQQPYAVAIGNLSQGLADYGVALGNSAAVGTDYSVVIGPFSDIPTNADTHAVVVGAYAKSAAGIYSVAIGGGTTVTPSTSTSTAGAQVNQATVGKGIAIGHDSYVIAPEGIAIGPHAKASGSSTGAIALGHETHSTELNAIAIGDSVTADHIDTVMLCNGSTLRDGETAYRNRSSGGRVARWSTLVGHGTTSTQDETAYCYWRASVEDTVTMVNGSIHTVTIKITGLNTTSPAGGGYLIVATIVRTNGGTVTVIDQDQLMTAHAEAGWTPTAAPVVEATTDGWRLKIRGDTGAAEDLYYAARADIAELVP